MSNTVTEIGEHLSISDILGNVITLSEQDFKYRRIICQLGRH